MSFVSLIAWCFVAMAPGPLPPSTPEPEAISIGGAPVAISIGGAPVAISIGGAPVAISIGGAQQVAEVVSSR